MLSGNSFQVKVYDKILGIFFLAKDIFSSYVVCKGIIPENNHLFISS